MLMIPTCSVFGSIATTMIESVRHDSQPGR